MKNWTSGGLVRLALLSTAVVVLAPQSALATCSPLVAARGASAAASIAGSFATLTTTMGLATFQMLASSASLSSAINSISTATTMSGQSSADTISVSVFETAKAAAVTTEAISQYRPSTSVCLGMVESDKVKVTEAHAEERAKARASEGTNFLTDSAGRGPVATVADRFRNEFLNNGFCDPDTSRFPLPSGMTCVNGSAGSPDRPVNADLMMTSILDDNIDPSDTATAWKKTAADRFIRHVLPAPPAIPKGDVLATNAGRSQFVAYQSWAAKAGVVNWILSSTAAMGEVKNFTDPGREFGKYSYRKALEEMAKGKFDAANPFADPNIVKMLAAAKETEKANIQLVAYKIGSVQSRLLHEIHGRLEMIAVADAILLSERLSRSKPGITVASGTGN